MRALVDGLLALPCALLPKRYWQSFDLPVQSAAPFSSFVTLVAGFVIAIPGYFAYLDRLGGASGVSILEISEAQVAGAVPETAAVSSIPFALAAVAPLTFAFFTPLGLLATYLVLSSVFRIASSFVEEPHGDPLVSGLDWLGRRSFTSYRQRSDRVARETLEGAVEPDRRYSGEWAGLTGTDYVIVTARQKPDWTTGTFVITPEGWFTLGKPFDRPTANGLRTVYPLTLQTTTLDVLRKGVSYELPPLRTSKARRLPETPGPSGES